MAVVGGGEAEVVKAILGHEHEKWEAVLNSS